MSVPNAEYTFGTHEAAVQTAERAKSVVWKSATAASVIVPRVCAFVVGAPLFLDLSGSAQHWQVPTGSLPAGKLGVYSNTGPQPFDLLSVQPQVETPTFNPQGWLVTQLEGAGEFLPPQTSQVQSSVRSTTVQSLPIPRIVSAPQPMDALQSSIETPMFNPQGRVRRQLSVLAEPLPAQTSLVSPSARTPPAVVSLPLQRITSAPQPLDSIASQIETPMFNAQGWVMPVLEGAPELPPQLGSQTWQGIRATLTIGPVPLRTLVSAPLPMDPPVPVVMRSVVAGATSRVLQGFASAPLTSDLNGAAWVWPAVRTPPILGPTVRPFNATPAYMELAGWAKVWGPGVQPIPLLLTPTVQGLPYQLGELQIIQSGFTVGTLTYVTSASPVGTITLQNPAGDLLRPEFSPIALQISSGPVSPVVPPQRGGKPPNLPNIIMPPSTTLVSDDGTMKSNWWRFFLNVSQQAFGTNSTGPASVTVGASPFVYVAPVQGSVLISGGPVSLIEYSKDGTTWFPTGQTGGSLQLVANDHVRVTFTNAPSMTFFPR